MTATFSEAYNDILTIFKDAWDTTGYDTIYSNVTGDPPETQVPWARVNIQHGFGDQTLGDASSKIRYTRTGLFFGQLFMPTGEGLPELYDLAKLIADAYEGKSTPNGVWFRNVRVNEVGPDGSWYQINVIAEFTYDEVK